MPLCPPLATGLCTCTITSEQFWYLCTWVTHTGWDGKDNLKPGFPMKRKFSWKFSFVFCKHFREISHFSTKTNFEKGITKTVWNFVKIKKRKISHFHSTNGMRKNAKIFAKRCSLQKPYLNHNDFSLWMAYSMIWQRNKKGFFLNLFLNNLLVYCRIFVTYCAVVIGWFLKNQFSKSSLQNKYSMRILTIEFALLLNK